MANALPQQQPFERPDSPGTPEHTLQLTGQLSSIHRGFFEHSPIPAQSEQELWLSVQAPETP